MHELIFLGTGGARIVVSKQIRASGGIWLRSKELNIHIDPGPGALVRCHQHKLSPHKLDAIILSHKHLDHSADINVMIEAMTEGGFKHKGVVFVPADALYDDEDPVILRYIRRYPRKIEVIESGKTYTVGNVSFEAPLKHIHGTVETHGFNFKLDGKRVISYIADTRFFEALTRSYRGDVMIINVVRKSPSKLDHLCIDDVREIIKAAQPKACILTHFGMTILRANPWRLAAKLAEETNIKVIAATDGLHYGVEAEP